MAQSKKGAIKSENTGTEKKGVSKASPPKPTVISTLEEATELVKESYKNASVLEYTVLENGIVFYGINRNAALAHARIFGLKTFDVKF